MGVIEGGVSTAIAGVGAEAGSPLHVVSRPFSAGVLGHYRTSHRFAIVNSQAAASKLFELQNPSPTNLVVISRIFIQVIQTAAHTAAIENSIDIFKTTAHSVISTTGTVTPVISKMRNSYGTAGTNVRGCTVAGVAAGMTGFTMTKDTAPLVQLPMWHLLAVPTAGPTPSYSLDYRPATADGESPLVLVQNEGIVIDNRVALGVAAGSGVYISAAWAELAAF